MIYSLLLHAVIIVCYCVHAVAKCPELQNPQHGFFNYTSDMETNQRVWNTTASYGCDFGFSLRGVATRVCQSDKRWSGEEPYCAGMCLRQNQIHFLENVLKVIELTECLFNKKL